MQSIAAPIKKEDVTGPTFHVFVGDLSAEVTDQVLLKAFEPFGKIASVSLSLCLIPLFSLFSLVFAVLFLFLFLWFLRESRIIWDPVTGKSRGYGFISFVDRTVSSPQHSKANTPATHFPHHHPFSFFPLIGSRGCHQ